MYSVVMCQTLAHFLIFLENRNSYFYYHYVIPEFAKKKINVKFKKSTNLQKKVNYAKDEQNLANHNGFSFCTELKATTIKQCHDFLT